MVPLWSHESWIHRLLISMATTVIGLTYFRTMIYPQNNWIFSFSRNRISCQVFHFYWGLINSWSLWIMLSLSWPKHEKNLPDLNFFISLSLKCMEFFLGSRQSYLLCRSFLGLKAFLVGHSHDLKKASSSPTLWDRFSPEFYVENIR